MKELERKLILEEIKDAMAAKFSGKKKKPRMESMFEVNKPKIESFTLGKDSTSMAYFALLKPNLNKLTLQNAQQADSFMSAIMINMV